MFYCTCTASTSFWQALNCGHDIHLVEIYRNTPVVVFKITSYEKIITSQWYQGQRSNPVLKSFSIVTNAEVIWTDFYPLRNKRSKHVFSTWCCHNHCLRIHPIGVSHKSPSNVHYRYADKDKSPKAMYTNELLFLAYYNSSKHSTYSCHKCFQHNCSSILPRQKQRKKSNFENLRLISTPSFQRMEKAVQGRIKATNLKKE